MDSRNDPEGKMMGLGCIMASVSVSFGMLAWIINLLVDKGLPL